MSMDVAEGQAGAKIGSKEGLDEHMEYLMGVRSDLMRLKSQGVFRDKNIAVVGTWRKLNEINKIMDELGLKLTHIADNDPNNQNVSRLGIICQSVESLMEVKDLIILVLNNCFWKKFQSQLTRLGFAESKDFYIVYGGETFRKLSLQSENIKITDQEWGEVKRHVEQGYQSYIQIYERYGGLPIWLMHTPCLGDLYNFLLFLPSAMGVSCIKDCECVLVVVKNSVKKLADVIGFKHIELITLEEAKKNWLALMRLAGDKLNVYNAMDYGMSNIFVNLECYSDVNFRDSFTRYVFQFENEMSPIYPQFPRRERYILEQFKEYGLIPGKTVLIAPCGQSFKATITEDNWAKLVNGLKNKGYTVCTNCGSVKERPLLGTEAPFIELCDCVEFAEMAGYFIGVRSGFCDLVSMADCQKIVIYETGAPPGRIVFFGFENMGLGKNVTEIVNDCIRTDEMIDDILNMF